MDRAQPLIDAGLLAEPLGRASLGGYVYRGTAIPGLVGKFVNGDFAAQELDGQILVATDTGNKTLPWSLTRGFVFDRSSEINAGYVKAIGEDAFGELYAMTGEFDGVEQIDGRVFKIVDASITADNPAASPTAIPVASPVASSAASPVASPVAGPSTATSATCELTAGWASIAAGAVFAMLSM